MLQDPHESHVYCQSFVKALKLWDLAGLSVMPAAKLVWERLVQVLGDSPLSSSFSGELP